MKKNRIFIALLFLLAGSLSSFAQTADDVIDKYIQAIGGLDNIKAINSMIQKGNIHESGLELPVTLSFKRDNKFRSEITLQGNSLIQAFDGTTAWQINPHSGNSKPDKMPVESVRNMKDKSDFEGLLVNYSQKGYTAELVGKEDVEGSETYKLKLTNKDNDVTYYFIDTQSFLILKKSGKRIIMEKEIEYEIFYSNYKSFSGFVIPLTREFKGKNDGQSQIIVIESVEINPVIDDKIFSMPE